MVDWITSTRLLEALHDPDGTAAWDEFVGRFRTPIVSFARKPSLVIMQTRPLLSEQLAQDAVLLLEILDNSGLLLVHPSRDRDEQDIPWDHMHGAGCSPRHPVREGEP